MVEYDPNQFDVTWLDDYVLLIPKRSYTPVARRKIETVKTKLVIDLFGESCYNQRTRKEVESYDSDSKGNG